MIFLMLKNLGTFFTQKSSNPIYDCTPNIVWSRVVYTLEMNKTDNIVKMAYLPDFNQRDSIVLVSDQAGFLELSRFFKYFIQANKKSLDLVSTLVKDVSFLFVFETLQNIEIRIVGSDKAKGMKKTEQKNKFEWIINSEKCMEFSDKLESLAYCVSHNINNNLNGNHQYLDCDGDDVQVVASFNEYPVEKFNSLVRENSLID